MTYSIDSLCAALEGSFSGRVARSNAIREAHARDESRHSGQLPDVVFFPRSTADVSRLLSACCERSIPITAFGAGTGLEGGAIPTQAGVSIDLTEMNQVIAIHESDFDAVVQPGVTHRQLNAALRTSGLFFPVDPGADASLGGMAATRASGTNAVRYGTMRENVLALEVVLADGKILRTGGRSKKSAAGYDLTRLFVGSEGTLGIITELTVRLHGIPEATAAAVCQFDSLAGAVETVVATIQSGVPIARIELLDDLQIEAVNRYSKLSFELKDTLFLEFHGSTAGVQEQALLVQDIARDNGGSSFEWRTDAAERAKLWQARHDVGWACRAFRPGASFFSTDVCVPISRLVDCILGTKEDLKQSALIAPLVGHVGDGNFHLTILVKPDSDDELEEAKRLNGRLIRRALDLDGTCTGEHGVGLGKREYLRAEHGDALDVMAELKRRIDPSGILNPGKIFAEL
ncbi:MAG: FAD-linked oxidase C-terminal domain-containing protein [Bdellovibrionota bacterium]